MIKNSLFFLLITLLLTGCVERGYTVHKVSVQQLTENTQKIKEEKTVVNKTDKDQINKTDQAIQVQQKSLEIDMNNTLNTEDNNTTEKNQNSFFFIEDEDKRTLSGLFMIVIGLIILI